jgi:tetraacyldisaccharide 4'-kinase
MRAPDFWYGKSSAGRVLGALLSPLSIPYRAAAWSKSYRKGFRPRARVLCIGNLTVGGSGKTPVALSIAQRLQQRGKSVAFLTRGYGGALNGPLRVDAEKHDAKAVGDEALLLAHMAPTYLSRDRARGAELADADGFDILVMDDGFQNPSLHKDVSLIVIDAASGFGNSHVVPAGPLREPVSRGLARAQAVIIVGDGAPALDFRGPVLRARLEPKENPVSGLSVVAYAGIGRPEKFFATLQGLGADVVATRVFPDHHPYSDSEIMALRKLAREKNAQLVTTEKDFVRLAPRSRQGMIVLPVHAVFDDASALDTLLAQLEMMRP